MSTYLYSSSGDPSAGKAMVYVADAETGQPIGRITSHPQGGVTARFVFGPDADVDGPLYSPGTTQRIPGIVGLGRFDRPDESDAHIAIDRAHRDIQRRSDAHHHAQQQVAA